VLAGFAVGAATVANGPGIHHRDGAHAGARHRRDYFNFYVGSCRFAEVAAGSESSELYRLGKESRCCYQGGYSQEKEFSLVSYDLYKYFRDNTKGFLELTAFPAPEPLFGVRRAGTTEAAQSYPGEFVSGNYFTMFGIKAYAGRALTDGDDQLSAPPVAVMSYRLWQEKYGSDPSVIGSVFNLNDKPFTVVGITPPVSLATLFETLHPISSCL